MHWIKNLEAHAGLRVMSITASDMVRQLESAVQFGQPVLLVDVLEEIDPVLEPLLAKAYVRWGLEWVVLPSTYPPSHSSCRCWSSMLLQLAVLCGTAQQ